MKFEGKIADIGFTKEYVREAYKKKRIIEITLEDGNIMKLNNWKEAVDELGPEPNVILEANNEYLSNWEALPRAKEKVDYIKSKGFIGGDGAWGRSHHGEEIAAEFAKVNVGQIWDVHQGPYPPFKHLKKTIEKAKESGKVVLCNELLVHDPEGEHGWKHPVYLLPLSGLGIGSGSGRVITRSSPR